jgi:hypothetical protein
MDRCTRAVILASLVVARVAHGNDRDPNTALGLSIAGSVVAVGLIIPAGNTNRLEWKTGLPLLVGAELAPSIGHVYAGDYLSAGLLTRLAGGGLIVLGAADPFPRNHNSFSLEPLSPLGGMCLLVGLGLTIAGTAYDVATSPAAARHHAHHRDIAPAIMPTPHGAPGFGLAGTF